MQRAVLESSDLVQNDPRRDAVILVVVENPLLDGSGAEFREDTHVSTNAS